VNVGAFNDLLGSVLSRLQTDLDFIYFV